MWGNYSQNYVLLGLRRNDVKLYVLPACCLSMCVCLSLSLCVCVWTCLVNVVGTNTQINSMYQ